MRGLSVAIRPVGACQIDITGCDILVCEHTLEEGQGGFRLIERPV